MQTNLNEHDVRSYPSRTQHRPRLRNCASQTVASQRWQCKRRQCNPARGQEAEARAEARDSETGRQGPAMKVAVAKIMSTQIQASQRSHYCNHPHSRSRSTPRSELSGSRSRSRPRAHHDNGLLHRAFSLSRPLASPFSRSVTFKIPFSFARSSPSFSLELPSPPTASI